MTALRGSCLCGEVRFEIDGPLMRSSHCHCRQCQKAHGAPFRTIGRGTDKLARRLLPQGNAYAMTRRRAAGAGIDTKLGNHSFRSNRDHRLSQERRHARKSCGNGQPCVDANDTALRSTS